MEVARSIGIEVTLDRSKLDEQLRDLSKVSLPKFSLSIDPGSLDRQIRSLSIPPLAIAVTADTRSLERQLSAIRLSTRSSLNLVATVDDRALFALNRHIESKRSHIKDVQRWMDSTPITPRIDLKPLLGLSAQLSKLTTAQNVVAVSLDTKAALNAVEQLETTLSSIQPPTIAVDSSQIVQATENAQTFISEFENIESKAGVEVRLKAQHTIDTSKMESLFDKTTDAFGKKGETVAKEISKKISDTKVKVGSPGGVLSPITSVLGGLTQGVTLSIGQKVSSGFSNQSTQFFKQAGSLVERYVTDKGQKLESQVARDFGYKDKAELRKDVGRVGSFVDSFIDPDKVRESGKLFEKQLSEAAVDFFVNKKSLAQIGKEYAEKNPLPRGAAEAGVRVAGFGLQQVSPILRINKDVQLAKAAQQVNELAEKVEIDPVRKREIEKSNGLLYATGGLNNAQGKSGALLLKPQLERIAPGAVIQPLSNTYRDTNAPLQSNVLKKLLEKSGLQNKIPEDYLKFLDTAVFSGATPDVIKAAAEAKAYQQATNKPVYGVGYSAGGADIADLVRLGELTGTDIKGVGLGAPIAGLTQRPSENFRSIQGGADTTVRGLFQTFTPPTDAPKPRDFTEVIKNSGLIGAALNPIDNTTIVETAGLGHSLGNYLASPGVQKELQGFFPGVLPDQLPEEYQNKDKVSSTIGKQGLDFALAQSQKRPEKAFAEIQDIRDRTPSEGSLARGIEKLKTIKEEYRTPFKFTKGSVKDEVNALLKSIELAIAAFEELKASGGKYTEQYRKLIAESDAAKKEYQKLATENLQAGKTAIFAKRDFKEAVGVGGDKVKETVGGEKNKALDKAAAIANSIGLDTSLEFAEFEKQIAEIGGNLEPLFDKAKDLDILPVDQVLSLYDQISAKFNTELDELDRLSEEFVRKIAQKPIEAKKQVGEILPSLNRKKELIPLAQKLGIEDAEKLKKRDLIAKIQEKDIGLVQPEVLSISRGRAQRQLARQERLADIAQTTGSVVKGSVEAGKTAVEIGKKAAGAGRAVLEKGGQIAGAIAGNPQVQTVGRFAGAVGKGTLSAAITAGKIGYKAVEGVETVALDMLPMGHTAKMLAKPVVSGLGKGVVLPALAYGAATHMLPGGAMVAEGMQSLLGGALSPVSHAISGGLTGQATQALSHLPQAFGIQQAVTSGVTGVIDAAVTKAMGGTAQIGAAILGGRLITNVGGRAASNVAQAAGLSLPQGQETPALPSASQKKESKKRKTEEKVALPPEQLQLPASNDAVPVEVVIEPPVTPTTKVKQTKQKKPAIAQSLVLPTVATQPQIVEAKPVAVEVVTPEIAKSFQDYTKPQLLAATRKLGIKGTSTKTSKDDLITFLRQFRSQSQVDDTLKVIDTEIGRDGRPLAGYDKNAEKQLIKQFTKAEKDLNSKIVKYQNASGKKREQLLDQITSGIETQIAEIDRVKGENISGETVKTLAGIQGRLRGTSLNRSALVDAKLENVRVAQETENGAKQASQGSITSKGLARVEIPKPGAFEKLKKVALTAIRSPQGRDLLVNGAGFAASTLAQGHGAIPALAGDLMGALAMRHALSRGNYGNGSELTGDIAGWAIGNLASAAGNAMGIGLPLKGAAAAMATVPMIQKLRERHLAQFSVTPGNAQVDKGEISTQSKGLARVDIPKAGAFEKLRIKFEALLPNTKKQIEQIQDNYEAVYREAAKLSNVKFNSTAVPKLKIDNERLKQIGAQAYYDIEKAQILIDSELGKILAQKPEVLEKFREQLAPLIHESRHGLQFDAGKLSFDEAARGDGVNLQRGDELTDDQKQAVERSVSIGTAGTTTDPKQVRALETDAYAFEQNTPKILAGVAGKKIADEGEENKAVEKTKSVFRRVKEAASEGIKSISSIPLSSIPVVGGVFDKLFGDIKNVGGAINFAVKGFVGFQAASFVVPFLKSVADGAINAAFNLDRLKTALSYSAGSKAGGERALQFVEDTSGKFNTSLQSGRGGFKQLQAATKGTKVEGSAAKDLFTGITQASAVLGMSPEQEERAYTAVSQIAQKGKAQAEELRGQLAETGISFQIVADSIGVTTAQLNKMLEAGSVTAEDLLPKLGKQLQKEFGGSAVDASKSAVGALNNYNNALLTLQENFGKLIQPSVLGLNGLAAAIRLVGDNLGLIAKFTASLVVPAMLKYIATTASAIISNIALTGSFLGIELSAKGLGLAFKGLAVQLGGILAKFALFYVATEVVTQLFASFSLDETGKQFENLGNQGVESLNKIADAAKKAKDAVDGVKPKTTSDSGGENNTPSEGIDIGKIATFGAVSFKTDDYLKKYNEANPLVKLLSSPGLFLASGVNKLRGGEFELPTIGGVKRQQNLEKQSGVSDNIRALTGIVYEGFDQGENPDGTKRPKKSVLQSLKDTAVADKEIVRLRNLRALEASKPNADKNALEKIDAQIREADEKKAKSSAPVVELQNTLTSQKAGLKKVLEDPATSQESKERALIEIENIDQALSAMKKVTDQVETSATAGFKLANAFIEIAERAEEAERASRNLFNREEIATLDTKLATNYTDPLAVSKAGTRSARSQVDSSRRSLYNLKNEIRDQEAGLSSDAAVSLGASIPIGATGKTVGLDSSIVDLKKAKSQLEDKDGDKKRYIDQLIALKENKDKQLEIEKQFKKDLDALDQAKQAEAIAKIDRNRSIRESADKRSLNKDTVALSRQKLKGNISDEDFAIKSAQIQLQGTDKQAASLQKELADYEAAFKRKEITAEEYEKKRRDIENNLSDLTVRKAEQELAVREAVKQKILSNLELANRKAEGAIALNRTSTSTSIKREQLRGMDDEDAAIKQNDAEQVANAARGANARKQLEEVKKLRADKIITEKEFVERSITLNQQIAESAEKAVDLELQKRKELIAIIDREFARKSNLIELSKAQANLGLKQLRLQGTDQSEIDLKSTVIEENAAKRQAELLRQQIALTKQQASEGKLGKKEAIDKQIDLNRKLADEQGKQLDAQITRQKLLRDEIELTFKRRKDEVDLLNQQRDNSRDSRLVSRQESGEVFNTKLAENDNKQAELKDRRSSIQEQKKLLNEQLKDARVFAGLGNKERADKRRELNKQLADLERDDISTRKGIRDAEIEQFNLEVDARVQASVLANNKIIRGIEKEAQAYNLLNKSLETSRKLIESRGALSAAKSQAEISKTQGELDIFGSAIAVSDRAKNETDGKKKSEARKVAQKLGVSGKTDEQLLDAKFQKEQQLAQLKENALIKEYDLKAALLELELKRDELAAKRAVRDAQKAENEAKNAALDAQGELDKAIESGDSQAIARAQDKLANAQQNVSFASENVSAEKEALNAVGELAANAREKLEVERGSAFATLDQENQKRFLAAANERIDKGVSVDKILPFINKASISAIPGGSVPGLGAGSQDQFSLPTSELVRQEVERRQREREKRKGEKANYSDNGTKQNNIANVDLSFNATPGDAKVGATRGTGTAGGVNYFRSSTKPLSDAEKKEEDKPKNIFQAIHKELVSIKELLQKSFSDLTNQLSASSRIVNSGSSLPALPGREHGGTVFAGQPYIVGERGREMFVPDQLGRIIPHDQTEKALSSNTGKVTSNVSRFESNRDLLSKVDELNASIEKLARSPKSVSFTSSDPVSDYADYMHEEIRLMLR